MNAPETVPAMLARAEATGAPLAQLVAVADHWVARWAKLADEVAAGAYLDGRASIYTGETYAEARDRWSAYRRELAAQQIGGGFSG